MAEKPSVSWSGTRRIIIKEGEKDMSMARVKAVRRKAESVYSSLIKAGFNAMEINNIGVEIRIMAENWGNFAEGEQDE